jgi:hypothetical protein
VLAFPWWNDIFQDVLILVQEGKLAHASFLSWWNDVVRDVLVLVQDKNLAHGGMMFSRSSCACARRKYSICYLSPMME